MREDEYKKLNEMNKKKDGDFFKHFRKELDVDITKEKEKMRKIKERQRNKNNFVFKLIIPIGEIKNG